MLLEQFQWENLGGKVVALRINLHRARDTLAPEVDLGFYGPGGDDETEELGCGWDWRIK